MHVSRYQHVSFLKSYDHGNLQLSTRRARSNVIESSCHPVQPSGVKTQNFHLCLSILSPHFTMTTTVAPVNSDRPDIHLQ